MDGLVTTPSPSVPGQAEPDDPSAGSSQNYLLIGSDQRDGANEAIAGPDSTRGSDTTILAHISSDRTRVELVSIPRDSMVRIPSCSAGDGSSSEPRAKAQFNKAFAIGWELGGDLRTAAACTWNTVQENTGLAIDHVVVVDMVGFQQMIDAIGGVDICIPSPMKDEYTGLDIPTAGMTHLDGVTALQFARARHVEGTDGSDLNRIGSQQRLLAAVMTSLLSKHIVTDVPELLSFLSAVTSSLTLDDGLSLPALSGLAYSARNLSSDGITFMTIPNGPDPDDSDRVVWTAAAGAVWSDMAHDVPIVAPDVPTVALDAPGVPVTPSASASSAAAPPVAAPPTTAPLPVDTKNAGHEPFTGSDVTATCD